MVYQSHTLLASNLTVAVLSMLHRLHVKIVKNWYVSQAVEFATGMRWKVNDNSTHALAACYLQDVGIHRKKAENRILFLFRLMFLLYRNERMIECMNCWILFYAVTGVSL